MAESAAEIAARMTEGLDDSLNPIDGDGVIKEDDKKTPPADPKKPEDTDEDDDDDKGGAGKDDDKKDDDEGDDDGYSIDEADIDVPDEGKPTPPAADKPVETNLTPEQQYIVNNLKPLKLRGVVGDSEDVQEFTVYDPSQLPAGFRFLDDRDRTLAGNAFSEMTNRANNLQNEFRSQETIKAQKAFKEAEEKADWEDIASMQKDGVISKFKAKPNDKEFDNDPTVQLIDKVLDFKDELNAKYLEDANNGRPYRHIGFEEAYHKYKRENPDKKEEAQKKEDNERKEFARRTNGAKGQDAKGSKKAVALRSKRDIDNFIDSLEFE